MRDRLRLFMAATMWLAAAIPTASSAVDSFRIHQLYSNQDGNWQFVELEEVAGSNGQDQWTGLALSVTNRYGVTKTFIFPASLPNANTAGRHVTIVSQQLAQERFPADFVVQNQFLPTDGGTIEFAGIDRWTFDTLPIVGTSLVRDGDSVTMQWALYQTFAGRQMYPTGGFTTVYEYYDSSGGHYFMSGSQPDIDALDTGRIAGWQRTGEQFYVPSVAQIAGQTGVCRYYIPPASHFYSASTEECAAVALQNPSFVLEESVAFAAWLPDAVTGQCPPAPYNDIVIPVLVPVYRLWNNDIDTNHRYTTDPGIRDQLLEQGWIAEGYGPDAVAMCVLNTLDF